MGGIVAPYIELDKKTAAYMGRTMNSILAQKGNEDTDFYFNLLVSPADVIPLEKMLNAGPGSNNGEGLVNLRGLGICQGVFPANAPCTDSTATIGGLWYFPAH